MIYYIHNKFKHLSKINFLEIKLLKNKLKKCSKNSEQYKQYKNIHINLHIHK